MCPDNARHKQYPYPHIRRTAKYHLIWRDIIIYEGEYKRRNQPKATITLHSINRPPLTKKFRTRGGEKLFVLTKLKRGRRKVIIVAKTKKRTKAVETDELEELEGLEDLDEELEEIDDEDEEDEDDIDESSDDDEEEDDEEDEHDEPTPKKTKKTTAAKAKTTKTKKKSTKAGIGTSDVAEHFGTEGRILRMVLRKYNIPKNEESKRYEWSSLNHPDVKKIGKLLAKGAAKEVKKEGLDKLKDLKKATSSKSSKKIKKKEVEDLDDIVEDDEDED